MKRTGLLLFSVMATAALCAAVPNRFFVGRTEVTETFWNQMPDSLNYVTSQFNSDTLTVCIRELPYTHYIDSVSTAGEYVLRKRSPEIIAELEQALGQVNQNLREQSLSIRAGEMAPQISLIKYEDRNEVDNFIVPGKCYLLSFWATWCGNCLQELKPEYLPSVAEQFSNDLRFSFVPICIDAQFEDLQQFFSSQHGKKWEYLTNITYLDPERKANEKFGESGLMPLNVVVGKDGRIRYIHSGTIKDETQLSALAEAIKSGL